MIQFLLHLLVFFGEGLQVNKMANALDGPDDRKTALGGCPRVKNGLYLV